MEELLKQVFETCLPYTKQGEVASYIPELKNADPNDLAICITSKEDGISAVGDFEKRFTMQSVIKPIILLTALIDNGIESVRRLVGVEATGKPFDAFNYSDQALKGDNINPMVNAGAIALCTLIKGKDYNEKFAKILNMARKMSGNPELAVDEQVYHSEKMTGNKNRALAYMMKAYGMISDDVESILDCYFRACSVLVSVSDLANMALVLAFGGVDPHTNERIFEKDYARYINAVLTTSGMYDGSGEFALNVGIPAKSGVGGGIMAVVPHRMGIGIYSPSLDKKGNSVAGVKALEILSRRLELSIF